MGNITSIQKALDIAFVQFGIDNSIQTALEDIDAPTSTDTPYLSSFNFPVLVGVKDLATTDQRTGFYQVDINYASHLGAAQRNKMADLLNETFFSGVVFSHGGACVIIGDVIPSPSIPNGGWTKTSLTINWSLNTNRI